MSADTHMTSRSGAGLLVTLLHVAHLNHWKFTSVSSCWSKQALHYAVLHGHSWTVLFWYLRPSYLESTAGPLTEPQPHSEWI